MAKHIIGVGAPQCGMGFLQAVLSGSDGVFLHPLKSVHYFDTKNDQSDRGVLKKTAENSLVKSVDSIVTNDSLEFVDDAFKCKLRSAKILMTTPIGKVDYTDLFRPCINGATYLAEVTADYMLMSDEAVGKMAKEVGSDTKIILMVRNPVDRFINSYRLTFDKDVVKKDFKTFKKAFDESIEKDPDWIKVQDMINDYKTAFEKYSKHFDEVLFLSFDEVLSKPMNALQTIEKYLGVEVDPTIFAEQIKHENKSIQNDIAKPGVRQHLSERYKESLDFFNDYFS